MSTKKLSGSSRQLITADFLKMNLTLFALKSLKHTYAAKTSTVFDVVYLAVQYKVQKVLNVEKYKETKMYMKVALIIDCNQAPSPLLQCDTRCLL